MNKLVSGLTSGTCQIIAHYLGKSCLMTKMKRKLLVLTTPTLLPFPPLANTVVVLTNFAIVPHLQACRKNSSNERCTLFFYITLPGSYANFKYSFDDF